MISGPMSFLYGKQAVYFFNPNDLDKINRNNFSNIYFIIPDKNLPSYEKSGLMEKLAIKEEYRIETTALDIVSGNKNEIYSKPINFPREQVNTIYGKIYQLK